MTTVVFVQTVHAADDERVWYHQVASLRKWDCRVTVVAPFATHVSDSDVILYSPQDFSRVQLMRHLSAILSQLHPDVVVCDTPMAICSAKIYCRKHKASCRVLYDVTEWYPSKKNLRGLAGLRRFFKRFVLNVFNSCMCRYSDGFIFGEIDKALPIQKRFHKKEYVFISYYPDLQYIQMVDPSVPSQELRLFYSGNLTAEKGFPRVVEVAKRLAVKNPAQRIVLNVVSNDEFECELPENMTLNLMPFLPFRQFCEVAAQNDLFLDLRDDDEENTRCLPIKLFYYMAMGRPVIYSNLSAIRKGCPEIDKFGMLVSPDDVDAVVDRVVEYLHDGDMYLRHCSQARELSEQKYNWKAIEGDFVRFILQNEYD